MGIQLHPIQNIVNVKWGKGVFVACRYIIGRSPAVAIYYGHSVTGTLKWTPLGPFGIGEAGGLTGCAVSKESADNPNKTFVIVGQTFEEPQFGSIILTSADGKKWDVTYKKLDVIEAGHFSNESMTGAVWDEDAGASGAFYASAFARERRDGPDVFSERLYHSIDGRSWELAQESTIDLSADPATYNSIILQHCNKPENQGGMVAAPGVQRMPDGLQAYDAGNDIFMKPKDLIHFGWDGAKYRNDEPGTSVTIRRLSDDGSTYEETETSIHSGCFAVAYVGGIWVAGGAKSNLDASYDRGKTWNTSNVVNEPYLVAAIIGG
jgi:hypothetical protein